MTASLLLRLVIFGIGLLAAYGGIISASHLLGAGVSGSIDSSAWKDYLSSFITYTAVPLLFALACLGFGRTIARFLLGSSGDARIEIPHINAVSLLSVLIKALGVYLFSFHIGPAFATFFEFIAAKSGNPRFDEAQLLIDGIANGTALLASGVLMFKTDRIVSLVNSPSSATTP